MPTVSFIYPDPPLFLIPRIQLSSPPSISTYLPHTLHSNPSSTVLVLPTEIFSSLLIWLNLVATSASRKRDFPLTTLKMCRVRAFALSRVLAPAPSIMLMFVWFLCLFWCFVRYLGGFVGRAIFSLCAPWVWQLFPSTCPGDVVSCNGCGGFVEFWLGFVSFLDLGSNGIEYPLIRMATEVNVASEPLHQEEPIIL
ncbi:hypothetical protein L3X38_019633 [Prunus dulcis]|uniref:Transmembrane protein n=1 Tax=Prunus dulcis TaxID=3755 RepID=A0AAD4ZC84_PRUDU|nr:hypothetical protein L3X38_019633 [Prunus dulcis]